MNTHDFRYIFMPYCIQKLDDGRHIILNRNYKPLGASTSEWVIYKDHPSACKMKITAATAAKLSWNVSDDVKTIYLYNDGCEPTASPTAMENYLSKLALLAQLKVSF